MPSVVARSFALPDDDDDDEGETFKKNGNAEDDDDDDEHGSSKGKGKGKGEVHSKGNVYGGDDSFKRSKDDDDDDSKDSAKSSRSDKGKGKGGNKSFQEQKAGNSKASIDRSMLTGVVLLGMTVFGFFWYI
jgi:hypothetical protein